MRRSTQTMGRRLNAADARNRLMVKDGQIPRFPAKTSSSFAFCSPRHLMRHRRCVFGYALHEIPSCESRKTRADACRCREWPSLALLLLQMPMLLLPTLVTPALHGQRCHAHDLRYALAECARVHGKNSASDGKFCSAPCITGEACMPSVSKSLSCVRANFARGETTSSADSASLTTKLPRSLGHKGARLRATRDTARMAISCKQADQTRSGWCAAFCSCFGQPRGRAARCN